MFLLTGQIPWGLWADTWTGMCTRTRQSLHGSLPAGQSDDGGDRLQQRNPPTVNGDGQATRRHHSGWVSWLESSDRCMVVSWWRGRISHVAFVSHITWFGCINVVPMQFNTRLSFLKTWRCGGLTPAPSLTLTHWRTTYSPLVFVGCLVVHLNHYLSPHHKYSANTPVLINSTWSTNSDFTSLKLKFKFSLLLNVH